jgi:hypothetical protein
MSNVIELENLRVEFPARRRAPPVVALAHADNVPADNTLRNALKEITDYKLRTDQLEKLARKQKAAAPAATASVMAPIKQFSVRVNQSGHSDKA